MNQLQLVCLYFLPLFQGKTVRRNIIIQSSFPMPVKLSHLQLESSLSPHLIGSNQTSFARLYLQHSSSSARGTLVSSVVPDSNGIDLILQPQEPTIVATVVFDPAGACIDVLSATVGTETASDMPICHTGFSLDSIQGW